MPVLLIVVAVLELLVAGCSAPRGAGAPASSVTLPRPSGGSPDEPPVAAIVPGSTRLGERRRCIDGELARRGLNAYGDPEGTTYAGGSPLLDAVTGTTVDRYDHVVQRHPDIGTACSDATPAAPSR